MWCCDEGYIPSICFPLIFSHFLGKIWWNGMIFQCIYEKHLTCVHVFLVWYDLLPMSILWGIFLSSSVFFLIFQKPTYFFIPILLSSFFYFCCFYASCYRWAPELSGLSNYLGVLWSTSTLNFDGRRGIFFFFLNHLNWSSLILSAKIPPFDSIE